MACWVVVQVGIVTRHVQDSAETQLFRAFVAYICCFPKPFLHESSLDSLVLCFERDFCLGIHRTGSLAEQGPRQLGEKLELHMTFT